MTPSADPRPHRGDQLTGAGIMVSAAALAGILMVAAGGLGLVVCSGLLTLAGLASLVRHRAAAVAWSLRLSGLAVIIPAVVLSVWFAGSASWSPAKQGEALHLLSWQLLATLLAVWTMRGRTVRDVEVAVRSLVALVAGAGFLLALEAINGYALLRLANPSQEVLELERTLGRGAVAIAVLAWLAVLAAARLGLSPRIRLGLAAMCAFVATRFGMDMNIILLAAGGLAAAVAYALPRFALGGVFGAMALLVLAAPVIYPWLGSLIFRIWPDQTGPLSYERRAQMWEYAAARIAEKPVMGWGLDASRTFDGRLVYRGFEWANIQLHPHSSPLQIWLELGAVGAGLFALLLAGAGFAAVRSFGRDRLAAAGLASVLAALFLAFSFSFGAWQPWLWALVTLAAGWAIALRRLPVGAHSDLAAAEGPDADGQAAGAVRRP